MQLPDRRAEKSSLSCSAQGTCGRSTVCPSSPARPPAPPAGRAPLLTAGRAPAGPAAGRPGGPAPASAPSAGAAPTMPSCKQTGFQQSIFCQGADQAKSGRQCQQAMSAKFSRESTCMSAACKRVAHNAGMSKGKHCVRKSAQAGRQGRMSHQMPCTQKSAPAGPRAGRAPWQPCRLCIL